MTNKEQIWGFFRQLLAIKASSVHLNSVSSYIKHLLVDNKTSLSQFVSDSAEISMEESKELINLGAIYLNKVRQMQDIELKLEDYVRLHFKPKRYSINWIWQSLIHFENEDFLIAVKPYQLPSVPCLDNYFENLLEQLKLFKNCELYPVNRLDQPTTGLILFAKSKKSARELSKMMELSQINKSYRALVFKEQDTGTYIHYMKKSPKSPKQLSDNFSEDFSLKCELEITNSNSIPLQTSFLNDHLIYPVLELPKKNLFELNINLHTGRTHQIRAQLNELKNEIIGDPDYGKLSEYPLFALQSARIWFSFKGQEFDFSYSMEKEQK